MGINIKLKLGTCGTRVCNATVTMRIKVQSRHLFVIKKFEHRCVSQDHKYVGFILLSLSNILLLIGGQLYF